MNEIIIKNDFSCLICLSNLIYEYKIDYGYCQTCNIHYFLNKDFTIDFIEKYSDLYKLIYSYRYNRTELIKCFNSKELSELIPSFTVPKTMHTFDGFKKSLFALTNKQLITKIQTLQLYL